MRPLTRNEPVTVPKRDLNKEYNKLFFDALVPYKQEIFKYVQSYYRCFMGGKDITQYPKFEI